VTMGQLLRFTKAKEVAKSSRDCGFSDDKTFTGFEPFSNYYVVEVEGPNGVEIRMIDGSTGEKIDNIAKPLHEDE